MVFKRVTFMLMTAAILMMIACSESYRSTAPEDPIPLRTADIDKALAPAPEPDDIPLPMISLVGTLRIIGETGGCIYLDPDPGEFPHELDFSYCLPKPGPIKADVQVKVFGRFNPNNYSDCVGGAVFQVHEIVIIDDNSDASISASDAQSRHIIRQTDQEPAESDMPGCCLTYSGIYYSEQEGCGFLVLCKADASRTGYDILELTFQEISDPGIAEGSKLEITGNFRLHDKSPCRIGPLFNVIIFDVIDEGEAVADHRTDVGMN